MPNALAREKSPYLLQHATNPVHWLPWGEAAFAQARAEEKPIFLSIGYATCHWCHVMAHESFEDEATAALLNEHFVPVKVDREERPDVDKVYMAYVQALTGHGGWPLSAWLTPELKPFFGGTYFPPEERHGRPGFPAILRAIARGWREERAKLVTEAERVIATLRDYHAGKTEAAAEEKDLVEAAGEAFEKGFQHYYEAYDTAHSGFGTAPKFPRAGNLAFLFRCAALQRVETDTGKAAVLMAANTLESMARGGIHDHVGGGFHRYSVDEGWFVPHFEKMLYDQAQIAVNALEAWQATQDERHAWLVRDIFDYVLRDLAAPGGGFFSAEDADSAVPEATDGSHAEGAFYVWDDAELRRVVGVNNALVAAHFGVKAEGNVPAALDPHGEFKGKNILAQQRPLVETARMFALAPQDAAERLLTALERLRAVRAERPRPLLDDKIIAAWNGLAISAFARAACVPAEALADKREFYRRAAVRAAEFLQRELWDAERGVLFRCWREGRGAAEGFAEDYACVAQGMLDLYEATFDVRWLEWAEKLQAKMDELFWDAERGGWFNSAADARDIVLRLKEDYDGAEPAPGSVGALNLLRLGGMLHDGRLHERGREAVDAMRATWQTAPQALPQLLCALEPALEPARHVVLVGEPDAEDFRALAAELHRRLGPRRVILGLTSADDYRWFDDHVPWMDGMEKINGRATAYVCQEFVCHEPVTTPADLRRLLAGS